MAIGDVITSLFDTALVQKNQLAELIDKENKSIEAIIEDLDNVDMVQKLIDKKKQCGVQISIVTRNTKRNKTIIDRLKENQIDVILVKRKKYDPNVPFVIFAGNQMVWVGTKMIFKQQNSSKSAIESLVINDKEVVEAFTKHFAKIKEILR